MRQCALDICPLNKEDNPCCADCDENEDCEHMCEWSTEATEFGCNKVLQ